MSELVLLDWAPTRLEAVLEGLAVAFIGDGGFTSGQYYDGVHLAGNMNGLYRFCPDYRALPEAVGYRDVMTHRVYVSIAGLTDGEISPILTDGVDMLLAACGTLVDDVQLRVTREGFAVVFEARSKLGA